MTANYALYHVSTLVKPRAPSGSWRADERELGLPQDLAATFNKASILGVA